MSNGRASAEDNLRRVARGPEEESIWECLKLMKNKYVKHTPDIRPVGVSAMWSSWGRGEIKRPTGSCTLTHASSFPLSSLHPICCQIARKETLSPAFSTSGISRGRTKTSQCTSVGHPQRPSKLATPSLFSLLPRLEMLKIWQNELAEKFCL